MEKIDELFNQIYLLKLDIEALRTLVNNLDVDGETSTILSRISTLETGLSSEASSLSALNSVVSAHTSELSSLSSLSDSVSQNTSDISSLSTRMSSAESDISSNASSITDVSDSLDDLESAVDDLDDRVSTAEGTLTTQGGTISGISTNVGTLQSAVSQNTTDISTLSGDVETLQTNTTNMSRKNFVVNPDFHVNTAGLNSYSTSGTEMVYVDNWRMGSANGSVVAYTYEGSHYMGPSGYIKQVFELDRIRAFRGKNCYLTVCTSGTIIDGIKLDINIIYGSNNTLLTRSIDMAGQGTDRKMSVAIPINSLAKQCEIVISNTSEVYTNCKIKWLKLEMGTSYTTFFPPVDREEKYACCESYQQ